MKKFAIAVIFAFMALPASADSIGGTSYAPPPGQLHCSDPYCTLECHQVAQAAGSSFIANNCASACATTNHAADGSTPGAYMAQCIGNGMNSVQCAQDIAGLAPTGGRPGVRTVVKGFKVLFGPGGACHKVK